MKFFALNITYPSVYLETKFEIKFLLLRIRSEKFNQTGRLKLEEQIKSSVGLAKGAREGKFIN